MEIFYFILLWSGLKSIHFLKKIFVPTSCKFAIQNNPIMQLRLIFSEHHPQKMSEHKRGDFER